MSTGEDRLEWQVCSSVESYFLFNIEIQDEKTKQLRVWNPVNGELLQTIENPSIHAQWSADGELLLMVSKDQKSVQIWELAQK